MRIFYSPDSDPIILDNISNLNSTYSKLAEYLDSKNKRYRINANISGIPDPHEEFLPYIELNKSSGKVFAQFYHNRGLLITGSVDNLKKFIEAFKFNMDEDGEHHHPDFHLIRKYTLELGGLWPYIQADNDYPY